MSRRRGSPDCRRGVAARDTHRDRLGTSLTLMTSGLAFSDQGLYGLLVRDGLERDAAGFDVSRFLIITHLIWPRNTIMTPDRPSQPMVRTRPAGADQGRVDHRARLPAGTATACRTTSGRRKQTRR